MTTLAAIILAAIVVPTLIWLALFAIGSIMLLHDLKQDDWRERLNDPERWRA